MRPTDVLENICDEMFHAHNNNHRYNIVGIVKSYKLPKEQEEAAISFAEDVRREIISRDKQIESGIYGIASHRLSDIVIMMCTTAAGSYMFNAAGGEKWGAVGAMAGLVAGLFVEYLSDLKRESAIVANVQKWYNARIRRACIVFEE